MLSKNFCDLVFVKKIFLAFIFSVAISILYTSFYGQELVVNTITSIKEMYFNNNTLANLFDSPKTYVPSEIDSHETRQNALINLTRTRPERTLEQIFAVESKYNISKKDQAEFSLTVIVGMLSLIHISQGIVR